MKIDKKRLLCAMVNAEMDNAALSKRSGVSVTQISNIRQRRNTTYETACKLANALDVSVNDLIELEDQTARV